MANIDLDALLAECMKNGKPVSAKDLRKGPRHAYNSAHVSAKPAAPDRKRLIFDADRFRWLFKHPHRLHDFEVMTGGTCTLQRARDLIDQLITEESSLASST